MHSFEYGRGEQPELNQYCEEVIYYRRNKFFSLPELRLPYIVSSRINSSLIKNLLKDNYPVLLDGIHCTYYLYSGALKGRKVLVRLHNVEFEYYNQLVKSTDNFYKKTYFKIESKRLEKYEKSIAESAQLIAVNEKDKETYERTFGAKQIYFLPVFLPFAEVASQPGKGDFCLYHGNLSVSENEKAALWLLENVLLLSKIQLIIAGKNPSDLLKNKVSGLSNILLIENPSQQEMHELIRSAHIHLLPSFNSTGIKIKLLNALFNGRFIITNAAALEGTGLASLCQIAENGNGYIDKIKLLFEQSFSHEEIIKRESILNKMYDNTKNATQLMKWL
ncbi:MAG: glycosyltransferase [Ginsengibacter sp.]